MLLPSKKIISDGWLSLDVQVIEIGRSNPGTKVDDERVILMKFLTSFKFIPDRSRTIKNNEKQSRSSNLTTK